MSNSLIVDDNETSTPGDVAKLKEELAASQSQSAAKSSPEPELEADDVPSKYRGKSLSEIIEMHRNAESELGRRGNELGQYKKLTDSLLEMKRRDDLAKGGAENPDEPAFELPEISSSEILDDPTQAINKILSARDKALEAQRKKQDEEEQANEIARQFYEQHPDAQEIAQSDDFIKWVNQSPTRAMLGQRAAMGDLVAGDALLTEYKELPQDTEKSKVEIDESELEVTRRKDDPGIAAAKRASTESRGASSTDTPKGKVWRRLDLIRLKLEDPEAYGDEGFQKEIMRAYAEGRVK